MRSEGVDENVYLGTFPVTTRSERRGRANGVVMFLALHCVAPLGSLPKDESPDGSMNLSGREECVGCRGPEV